VNVFLAGIEELRTSRVEQVEEGILREKRSPHFKGR
jgi:hypothetical protein